MATGLNGSLSFALLGAGHLVGLAVGVAILLGLVIAWGVAVPLLTIMTPTAGSAVEVATAVWAHKVRFIGAGTIGAASIWTLGKLVMPVWRGILSSVASSKLRAAPGGATLPRTERDIPITVVGLISLLTLLPLVVLLIDFLHGGVLQSMTAPLVIGAVAYIVIAGFIVAAVCGFMAGLIGSSNSPVSGLAILAVLGAGLLLVLVAGHAAGGTGKSALVAFALFVTAVLLCVATIANDNLQDLKTGQLVDATPWRQQVALLVGVVMGAIVIPPILDLLNHAYGFGASVSHIAAGAAQPLPAPQATLISALAKGVIEGDLDWSLIGVGVLVGIGLIALDEGVRAFKLMPVPPLAVGLGIYLPASTSSFVVVGAVVGWAYDRWAEKLPNADIVKRLGVLLASGLIVGESLFGVLLAGLIVVSGKGEPLAVVGAGFAPIAEILGAIVFTLVTAALYRWIARTGRRTA
jgi:putative OPT family oligopeptide transporter